MAIARWLEMRERYKKSPREPLPVVRWSADHVYGWIDLKDESPDVEVDVIAYEPGHPSYEDDEGFAFVARLNHYGEWVSTAGWMEPTHWMPLPEPPEG